MVTKIAKLCSLIVYYIFYPVVIIFAPLVSQFKMELYKQNGRLRAVYFKRLFAECGKDFHINGKPILFTPEKIYIGNHVTINNGVQIAPRGNVFIGDYVVMSRGSQITAGELDIRQPYKERKHIQEDVYVGDGTWLCINSLVLPGVKITGKGVVVAAGAVVTTDITEDNVVVGGIPAKIIKRLSYN